MREKEPKIETKQKIQQEKIEGHSDIPLYEKLDAESQKFVVEVKELSEMSEEEFLEKYPKVEKLVEKAKGKHLIDSIRRTIKDGIRDSYVATFLGSRIAEFGMLDPEEVADKIENIGTMWDFVKLHLLELKDFLDTRQTDFHSRQTDYLANKIAEKIFLNLHGCPDSFYPRFALNKDKFLKREWDVDTGHKLILINTMLGAMHQYDTGKDFPPALRYIKDLWRYAIIRKPKINKTWGGPLWARQYNEYFEKLSNIKLEER